MRRGTYEILSMRVLDGMAQRARDPANPDVPVNAPDETVAVLVSTIAVSAYIRQSGNDFCDNLSTWT